MEAKNGRLSVKSENIFPIIKQWLYSEQEIFIREIVSNAIDAMNKRKHLMQIGELEEKVDNLRMKVHLDTKKGILTVSDQGVGMTEEEVNRYINQIAYSGLIDFVEKYEGESTGGQVIGHFGLGFYSAFMVSDKVEINTLSCKEGATAVSWLSNDGIEYTLRNGSREEVGTDVVMHLNPDAKEKYTASRVKELIKKYCGFMPFEIYFHSDADEAELINEVAPLWLKAPRNTTSEEYIEFYNKHFYAMSEPLFWVHLNLDYPFRLKGILYFPNENNPYVDLKNRINVYSKQVFVSDNLREMIPDFLFLLQGFLDCPDLPLNVSRSYLQSDATVRALSKHIVSKVADTLVDLYKRNQERYKEIWPKVESFIKIGSLQNPHFAEKIAPAYLLKETNGTLHPLEFVEEGTIYYIYEEQELEIYADRLAEEGKVIFSFNKSLDLQWMSQLEMMFPEKYNFKRVDSHFTGEVSTDYDVKLIESYLRTISRNENLKVEVRHLGENQLPIVLEEDEASRRLQDIHALYSKITTESEKAEFEQIAGGLPDNVTSVINRDHEIFEKLIKNESEELTNYCYQLALLAKNELQGAELKAFLQYTQSLL